MAKEAKLATVVLLLVAIMSMIARGAPIEGPPEFDRDTVATWKINAKGILEVDVPPGLSIVESPDGKTWYVAGKPGNYHLKGYDWWVDFDKRTQGRERVNYTFTIRGDAGPTPGPTPPGPTPPPDPSVRTNPFTDDAARVLVLFDPQKPLSITQQTGIYGQATSDALKAYDWRIWPKGQESKDAVWASALQKLPTSYPWIMAGKGSKGFSGPVNNVDDVMTALKAASSPPVAEINVAPVQQFRQTCTPIVDRFGRVVGYSNCP